MRASHGETTIVGKGVQLYISQELADASISVIEAPPDVQVSFKGALAQIRVDRFGMGVGRPCQMRLSYFETIELMADTAFQNVRISPGRNILSATLQEISRRLKSSQGSWLHIDLNDLVATIVAFQSSIAPNAGLPPLERLRQWGLILLRCFEEALSIFHAKGKRGHCAAAPLARAV